MKNNTIALLVGIFIVVMLVGILAGPEKVSQITGSSVSSSTATLNMSDEVSVLVTGNVDFGSGRVNSGASSAILYSDLGYYHYWNQLSILGTKPSASYSPFVYHSALDAFVLYSLYDFNTMASPKPNSGETWIFNISKGMWSQITSTANKTNAVSDFYMVYVPTTSEIFLFGGRNNSSIVLNETWKFNTSSKWQRLYPSVSPPPAKNHAMVFDSSRNVIVAYGGANSEVDSAYNLGGTWEYNISSNNWTNITTVNYPARSIFQPAMAFDSDRNVTVLFGGEYSNVYKNETWEYNGTNWRNVTSSVIGTPPGGLYRNSMIYNSAIKKIVLIGGYVQSLGWYSNQVWEYNGTHWTNIDNITASIFNDRYTSAAFNNNNNKTVIYGGEVSIADHINEVWEYEAQDWSPNASINGSWYFERGIFYVENDGTVNVSVNFSADNAAGSFVGGSNPSFMLKGVVDEGSSCAGLNTSYSEILTGEKNICPLLTFQNAGDVFKIPIKLVVPGDAPAGTRNSTITFTVTQIN